ncbi:methionine--tRNA ligase [Actinomadura logoneensis]|uniref:methionine--tRNA ligase n=1 Tax=Actinomadura logoneensis TaxID=2293572 RepID=A0A372J8T8_9ACTN|nr:class I tRNA ligase family protein [Actinomadura logoneensis]RFU36349.1 methionine--tRNA ligase [Actinomadura logoneensis]
MNGDFWLTATPPTPNGDLHVGHLAGPYVAVDVLRRFLVADGEQVLMTTGMDDHQSYVQVRGRLTDRTAVQVADSYGDRIETAWNTAGIGFDRVIRPRTSPGYTTFVQSFFKDLYDQGAIVPRTRPLPYCRTCDKWAYEAYVVGSCPHCGQRSNGNACEPCGRPNDCADLGDPRCVVCGSETVLRDQTRLYLPLAPHTGRLSRYWANTPMPPHLRALCEAMLADGLPEIAVSHPADWGVPVTVPGFTDQRIYVWFEMGPGYLWQADPAKGRPEHGPVQFFGFDNGYFHAVLFPALFMAWGVDEALPRSFVVNEFYRLDGEKFSTSRQHAVWALDALGEHGSDTLRFHVLRDRPNGRQTSLNPGDLDRTARHLDDVWNGWLRRLVAAVQRECESVVPQDEPGGVGWERFRARLERTVTELREAYSPEGFDPRRAADLLDEVVRCALDFSHVHEHEPDPAARRRAIAGQLAAASALSAWAAPALPLGAARLADLLGVEPARRVDAAVLAAPRPGTKVAEPDGPVFGEAPHGP